MPRCMPQDSFLSITDDLIDTHVRLNIASRRLNITERIPRGAHHPENR